MDEKKREKKKKCENRSHKIWPQPRNHLTPITSFRKFFAWTDFEFLDSSPVGVENFGISSFLEVTAGVPSRRMKIASWFNRV